MPDSPPEAVRARLGGFGFSQDKAFVPVGELSGGERARLNLALVTYNAPGLLYSRRADNHLDMETRESLVAALAEYSGAVVLVSHDWHLVELVADRLWLVDGGTVRSFEDDLDAYRRRLLERDEPAESRASAPVAANSRRGGPSRGGRAPPRAGAAAPESALGGSDGGPLAAEQQALDRTLAEPGAFGAGGALADALKRRAELERRIAQAEAEWFEAATELERLSEA
jgi:ATP-binding cassette subfamily F protein 3